jgi:preprotein translocase subunit SecE
LEGTGEKMTMPNRPRLLGALCLAALAGSEAAWLPQSGLRRAPLPHSAHRRGACPLLQLDPSESETVGQVEGRKPDLSQMTFEERLEYLSSQVPDTPSPEEEEEASLFGIDMSAEETVWWSPKFIALCWQDLQEMTWPSRKQALQTVVTSQIAFVVILITILVLDAVADGAIRSLIQGEEFSISLDKILKQAPG